MDTPNTTATEPKAKPEPFRLNEAHYAEYREYRQMLAALDPWAKAKPFAEWMSRYYPDVVVDESVTP